MNTELNTKNNFTYFRPILTCLILPIIIGLFNPYLIRVFWQIFYLIIFYMPVIILMVIIYKWSVGENVFRLLWQYLRPLPPGIVFGTDLKKNTIPIITISLIILNTMIYFAVPESTVDKGTFPPFGNSSNLQIVLSILTSAFLHGSFDHLLGNMVFLWTFGSALEPRIGVWRFCGVYFLAIAASKIFVALLLTLKATSSDSLLFLIDFHSLGASGAISGIMGIFAVRCFFARISVSLPIFIIPVVSIPLKVQGTFLLGLFFAMDLSGSVKQFGDQAVHINYWAHVGGYVGGFIIGLLMKLHHEAAKESTSVKATRLSQDEFGRKDALMLYRQILDEDPYNEDALLYKFKHYVLHNEEKALPHYLKLIQIYIKSDFIKAIDLFDNHYPRLVQHLPGAILLRLGSHFLSKFDLKKAQFCLEFASEAEGPWNTKSKLMLAQAYEQMGSVDRAKLIYQEIKASAVDADFRNMAIQRLQVIK